MKKTIFLMVFLVTSIFVVAQNKTLPGSYIIKDLVEPSKMDFYKAAIETANFEDLRLKDKQQEFKFENGFILVLSSATELKSIGLISDLSSYKLELDKDFQYPLFRISNEGRLVALYNSIPTKTDLKLNSAK